jgi:hypothetical protein
VRIVFASELNHLGHLAPLDLGDDGEAEIDSRRHAAARDAVAVDNHTFVNGLRTENG